jgi:hypothetical protein
MNIIGNSGRDSKLSFVKIIEIVIQGAWGRLKTGQSNEWGLNSTSVRDVSLRDSGPRMPEFDPAERELIHLSHPSPPAAFKD